MNKQRRKEIAKAIELIQQAREILEGVKDEEQEAFDNLPENLQSSESGEKMEWCISGIEDFLEYLDTDELQGIIDA
jgi:poly-gamma-glutamate capsule biosynthesis protein CapA/YwtB (metallophosphatase superfamily)